VAESGSFSAAARAAGLSQPNLSGQGHGVGEDLWRCGCSTAAAAASRRPETGRQLHGLTTRLFALQDEARALQRVSRR